jgi:nitrate/nitrite transporter NarK
MTSINPERPMRSDIPFYLLAALLGICAGLLEIKLGDLLATALFVMCSTMVLGFMRPKNAWRWIVVVAVFVPVIRIAAYAILKQKPYRAQIWESALGFLTGIAGAYGGVLARKGVDELFRPPE